MFKYYFEAEEKTGKKFSKKVLKFFKVSTLKDFHDRLPVEAKSETVKVLNKLSEDELELYASHYGTITDVKKITISDHVEGLNKLFNIKKEGFGRGEVMMVFLIPEATAQGGGESFDIKTPTGIYEVKEYMDSDTRSIRLGVKGKVTRFEFWDELMTTVKYLNRYKKPLIDYIGVRSPRTLNALENVIKRTQFLLNGEMNLDDAEAFGIFYANMNAIIENYTKSETTRVIGGKYTQATFRGADVSPKIVPLKPIAPNALSKKSIELNRAGETAEQKDLDDFEELIPQLQRIKYIRTPKDMVKDMDEAAKKATSSQKKGETLEFVVFRKNKIWVTTCFVYDKISQASIFVLEKSLAPGVKAERERKGINKKIMDEYEKTKAEWREKAIANDSKLAGMEIKHQNKAAKNYAKEIGGSYPVKPKPQKKEKVNEEYLSLALSVKERLINKVNKI